MIKKLTWKDRIFNVFNNKKLWIRALQTIAIIGFIIFVVVSDKYFTYDKKSGVMTCGQKSNITLKKGAE